MRDLQERLRGSHEEAEMQARRKAEVEKILLQRDAAYEELLGMLRMNHPYPKRI